MQVTVLTCRHVTDYKTSEPPGSLHSPFLKALKTQHSKETPCCSLLEQPNFAHDLPAAGGIEVRGLSVASWCCLMGSYYSECERSFWRSLLMMINNALLCNLRICSCQYIRFGLSLKFSTHSYMTTALSSSLLPFRAAVSWSLVTPVSQC